MKRIVDVVNFNADASCLSSGRWLDILSGGANSQFVTWLQLYIDRGKKVTLGFPGATVADIAIHNPEGIAVINSHPDIFELILRPFAHDIALLRLRDGFIANFELGRRTISREFHQVTPWFLPPEFMMTNEQIVHLSGQGVSGVFINPARFSTEIGKRIPAIPYKIRGLFAMTLDCIPFQGKLTDYYLNSLHLFDCTKWNDGIRNSSAATVFSWRDGESCFFLPDSLAREAYWLDFEENFILREHITDLVLKFISYEQLGEQYYLSYPVHSFTAWMKEFRMLGFVNRIQRLEENLSEMTGEQVRYWLMSINSDILSAIEKRSPVVQIKQSLEISEMSEHVIMRSERGFEGEEYLAILEDSLAGMTLPTYVKSSVSPHIVKWQGRIEYLKDL
jgi:hypothetical protein